MPRREAVDNIASEKSVKKEKKKTDELPSVRTTSMDADVSGGASRKPTTVLARNTIASPCGAGKVCYAKNRNTQVKKGEVVQPTQVSSVPPVMSNPSPPSANVEGAFTQTVRDEYRYVVPFMVNGDRVIAKKFNTLREAEIFAQSESSIVAWRTAHPEDDSLIGKIVECY